MQQADASSEEMWSLTGTDPFTRFEEIGGDDIYPFEGTLAGLKEALSGISDKARNGASLSFEWDEDALVLHDCMPSVLYLKNDAGSVIGAYALTANTYTLTPQDWERYRTETPVASVRLAFVCA